MSPHSDSRPRSPGSRAGRPSVRVALVGVLMLAIGTAGGAAAAVVADGRSGAPRDALASSGPAVPVAFAGPVPPARAAVPPPASRTVTAPCSATTRACVQISTQHVWLLTDDRVVRDGFIDSGATDMQTPTGTFRVQYKDATYVSHQYRTPMPYSVFFDDNGDALHEGSLARQSRGCVHLDHDDAVAFFDALRPGDVVQILP